MKTSMKNKLKLFITCIFSVFAVSVAGISTFAWFQQTQAEPQTVQSGTVTSGSSDLTINGVTGYKYAYDDTGDGIDYSTGHVSAYSASGDANSNIAQNETSSSLDAPSQGVGFYVLGDETWSKDYGSSKKPRTYASAIRLEDKYGNNWAALINYDFHKDEEIKIIWYHYVQDAQGNNNGTETEIYAAGGSTTTYIDSSSLSSSHTLKFLNDGNYTIWVVGRTDETPNHTLYITKNGNIVSKSNAIIRSNNQKSITRIASNEKVIWLQVPSNWGDWANPKIYYRGGSSGPSRNDRPTMINTGMEWGAGSKIYSYVVPSNTTSFKVTKNGNDTQTQDYTNLVSDGSNCCYSLYYDGGDKIKKVSSSFINLELKSSKNSFGSGSALSISSSIYDTCYLQYQISYTATANEQVKLCNTTSNDWFGYSKLEDKVDKTLFSDANNDDNIKITKAYSVKIYLKFLKNGGLSIWAENPVYYRLNIRGKTFNVATQTYNSASTLISFDVQKTNTSLISPEDSSYITTSKFPDKNNFTAPSTFKWYIDPDLTDVYDGISYSSDDANKKDLYCGLYEEKTVYITFQKSLWKGTTRHLDGTYNDSTETPTPVNVKNVTNAPAPNKISWGVTGNFDVDNFVDTPTEPRFTQYENGWSSGDVNNTDKKYASGTSITMPTTLTYYLIETKYSININYRYFDTEGNSFTNENLPANIGTDLYGYYSWNSGSSGVPIGTIQDVGLTLNVPTRDDRNYNGVFSKYLAFRHDFTTAKLYSDPQCTVPFTGHISANNTNLYLKMVLQPSIQLYIRKPDGNTNNVKEGWITIKAHLWNNQDSRCMPTKETSSQVPYVISDYIDTPKGDQFYTFEVPFGYKITLIGYSAPDGSQVSDSRNTPSGAMTIDLYTSGGNTQDYNTDSSERKYRGNDNVIQLRENIPQESDYDSGWKCRWVWGGEVKNQYYLVGENLTDDSSSGESWSEDSGLLLSTGGINTPFPDAKCYISKVILTDNVKFQVYNDLGGQRYRASDLATGETQNYVEDDNSEYHNIKVKTGIAGKFNIYLDNDYKIHVEDAETGGYLYFTGPTGLEQTDVFAMGYGGKELGYSGDNNVLVYDQEIHVEKGDQFAIRNRFRGQYQWFEWSHVNETSKSLVESGVTTTLGEAVYINSTLQTGSTKSVNTIKFKNTGSYRIFVYEVEGVYNISIIHSPDDGLGYYIIGCNSSATDASAVSFSGGVKMRTIGSGTNTNIAQYTGFRVTEADITSHKKFCFKSQTKEFVNGERAIRDKTYTSFYDNIYTDKVGLNETLSVNNKTFDKAVAEAFVTFKDPGYYDVYIYLRNGKYIVSFAKSNVGQNNFFTLNSIPKDRQNKAGIKASQTTLVIRVDFTVTAKTATTVSADYIRFADTGFGNYLKYFAVFDIADFDGLDPYKYMRQTYYDQEGFTYKSSSASLATTTINDNNVHSCYIMIDYSEDMISQLISNGSYVNNFKFVMKSTQQ